MADPPHPGMRPGARDLFITNFIENPPPSSLVPDNPARVQPPRAPTPLDSDDEYVETKHAQLENHCILCGDTLHIDLDADLGPIYRPTKWETNVICILSVSSSNDRTQSKLCEAQINQRRGLKIRNLQSREGTVYEPCTDLHCLFCGEEAATVNMIHIYCLQLAKRRWSDFSTDLLARIARLLRPITPPNVTAEILGVKPDLTKFPESEIASKDSSLGLLLANIHGHLPGELQRLICRHLSGTLFFSVASCLETLHWIEDHRILTDSRQIATPTYHYPLMPSFSFKRLVADTVNILGESCFTRIGGDFPTSYEMEITIKQVPISGIRYALGLHGVVGLRVLYEDGSSSAWLGRSPGRLFRVFSLRSLRDLRILTDVRSQQSLPSKLPCLGLKYLSLDSDTASGSQTSESGTSSEGHKIFWTHDVDFTPCDKHVLVTLHPIQAIIRVHQDACIGQYLPFQPAGQQQRSLTIFFSSEGTYCIQVGSDPGQRLGKPSEGFNRPLTFYLYPGETVKSLQVLAKIRIWRASNYLSRNLTRGFYILVRTSEGRTFYAAPNRLLTDAGCSLVDIGDEASHFPTGIFLVKGFYPDECFTNLGVRTGTTKEEQHNLQNPQETPDPWSIKAPRPRNSSSLTLERNGAILTKANRDNVKELRVQKHQGIYSGLLIHRHDGRTDVLGSWDASRPELISTIYVYGDRPFKGLTFVFSEYDESGSRCKNVVNITLDQVENSASKFLWDVPYLEVAWWFTLSKSENYVEYWDGEEQEVSLPKGSLNCKEFH
ncbi:unnamed protein product [Clonostachys solani]|uniref:Uncharacterized protein n=1 Tax=Clonostachys solani TaxID=160281 RepID=A0A9P0EQL2_9HYPO|nr:unnamed protein product [Clonostachys solani]